MISACSIPTLRFQPRCRSKVTATQLGKFRCKSSKPIPNARLPAGPAPSSRSWQRHFLVGLTIGAVVTPAYLYYTSITTKPTSFVSYTLTRKEAVSPTASIFYLDPSGAGVEFDTYKEAWTRGIWNFRFKQPQIQVVREYTPLPPLDDAVGDGQKQLRFLIRKDPHGEVSSYLHRLPLGSGIELQGPNLEYEVYPTTQKVIFFAGGTGIAPALQIAYAMFENEQDEKSTDHTRKLHILWANRTRADCAGGLSDSTFKNTTLSAQAGWFNFMRSSASSSVTPSAQSSEHQGLVVKELEQLKERYPNRITVDYFVNEEGALIDYGVVMNALARFDNTGKEASRATASAQSHHILISGPEGFISYLAGAKEWMNGREEQGRVGGLVAQALAQNPRAVTVWKI